MFAFALQKQTKRYELIIHTFILENNGPHIKGKKVCFIFQKKTWSKSNLHSQYNLYRYILSYFAYIYLKAEKLPTAAF